MSDPQNDAVALHDQIKSLVEGAEKFKAEHGSCLVTVGPNSPIAKARIDRVAGFWVDVDQVTLLSAGEEEDLVIDGSLIYFHATENERNEVTPKDIVCAVDWLGSSIDVEFDSADYSSVDESGVVYLEGRKADLLIDATFVLRDFSVRRDWDLGSDEWDEESS